MEYLEIDFDSRLDTKLLQELYEGDKDHAVMVFGDFLNRISDQLIDLEESFIAGDAEVFRKKVHKLKAVFSFVGLSWLTAKAEAIENCCIHFASVSSVKVLYEDFKDNLVEFLPVIEQEFGKLNR